MKDLKQDILKLHNISKALEPTESQRNEYVKQVRKAITDEYK